jgi:ADP-ribose pyrophosphatase
VNPPDDAPDADAHLIERGVSSREVYRGHLLQVMLDEVLLPDDSMARREYIVHPGAVAVVPRLPDGRILLERQYRYPLRRVLIEIPAGKLDPDESALACAKRELLEETGYRAQHWEFLTRMHPLVSYSTEYIDIYFADGLEFVRQHLDQGEFLETIAVAPEQAYQWLATGTITDAKSMLGLLLLRERLMQSQPGT